VKSYLQHLSDDEKYAIRAKQGLPFPLVELRAMNEQGPQSKEVPWDGRTMGELQVRGPWIAASYYKNEAEKDKWTADGWFRTGDVVTIDREGYIKIADRTKDMIKSGGEWISSVDLENALMGHPRVKEAAVIGLPHPKWLERPLAVVVLRDGDAAAVEADPAARAALEEELRAYLDGKFAKWQLPDGFAFTSEIPRTSVGKFKKSALRQQFKDWQWH
jgi:fatty-acyl-CoA synthase